MQEKESTSSWHFWISFSKSIVRIFAAIALIAGNLVPAGLMLIIAELLGIGEEL